MLLTELGDLLVSELKCSCVSEGRLERPARTPSPRRTASGSWMASARVLGGGQTLPASESRQSGEYSLPFVDFLD